MQDRFKFRAWNKLSKEMKDVIALNINYEFPECSNVILETNTFDAVKTHNKPIICSNSLNNTILMQCTGLKDKSGRLMYEGDIVQYSSINKKSEKTHTETYKIAWDDKFTGYILQNKEGINCFNIDIMSDKVEVIGNIYENPELLEANND